MASATAARGTGLVVVGLGFAVLTLAATWPLARHLGSSLPADLGDPLFVTWVMAWVQRHLVALATGDLAAFGRMWDAPIFAPETNTLAYSEHFAGQAVMTLPVSWAGGSPIAAYNAAFLASFWLSALGAFVFVRSLTGSLAAAVAAGVFYGFNVYRMASLSHLHTLTAQWPPFVLAGVLVFARTGSRPALMGAAAAFIATALSSGYYLAYFAPLVALFGGLALARHDAWRTPSGRAALGLAILAVAVLLVPFIRPYLAMQHELGMTRPRGEVEMSSFTLDAYAAAIVHLVPMLVLAAGCVLAGRSQGRALRWAAVCFALAAAAGFWLSLGPTPRWRGAALPVPGLYGPLMDYVPGFSALRVASRFAMVLMLALATLAGLGIALVSSISHRAGALLAAAGIAVHLTLYWSIPLPRDTPVAVGVLNTVPAHLDPAGPTPAVYDVLRATDPGASVVELPFGEPGYELRYMFFSLHHGHRLLNGYSGVFPPSYRARTGLLRTPWANPDEAWLALAPASLVVVHTGAWPSPQAEAVRRWLADRGAETLAVHDASELWRLPGRP